MRGDADIAPIAALMGEPARAAVLIALADGRALAATTLASEAGIAPSTASAHLARLVQGGLVRVERSGRHRYFRLAGPEVAAAMEALARLAPEQPIRSLRQGTRAEAVRRARVCYDHLAGRLGVGITDALVANGFVAAEVGDAAAVDPVLGAGRAHRYTLPEAGRNRLLDLGISLDAATRRPLIRYCVDWSEQRPHLGGRLGAALLDAFVRLRWVEHGPRRVVWLTDRGRHGLADQLGVASSALR
ncbi:MAG: helix-turn-helix transcriptional regulator [Candidatus Dormiibacterota bacterium]